MSEQALRSVRFELVDKRLEKEDSMSDSKIHPVTKQTLEQFLAEKEKEFLSEVAESESLEKSRDEAANHLAEASKHLLLAMKCKVDSEDLVQSTYRKRLDIGVETLRDINYEYCRPVVLRDELPIQTSTG